MLIIDHAAKISRMYGAPSNNDESRRYSKKKRANKRKQIALDMKKGNYGGVSMKQLLVGNCEYFLSCAVLSPVMKP